MPLLPGTPVDQYVVIRFLKRGTMSDIYLARDLILGRKVALKLISPDRLDDRQAIQTFLFEAQATATVAHQHVVTLYGVGEHDGAPYLVLEYLEGVTLRERISEGIALDEAIRHAVAIAGAIQEAHRNGILHLDLK